MKAPILDRKNSTLDSVEEHLFAQELNRNRRTLADFAPEQHRVPMVSEPQLRVDVRRPRFGTAFGKIRLHSLHLDHHSHSFLVVAGIASTRVSSWQEIGRESFSVRLFPYV